MKQNEWLSPLRLKGLPKEELATLLTLLLGREDFQEVYEQADRVRQETVGQVVHIRALLEFSSHCRRRCQYCGLSGENSSLPRYRMSPEEILFAARQARAAGYRTIVLQSGEDPYYTAHMLGSVIREIVATGLVVTVSCGERTAEEYRFFKNCGVSRYLLKHETADPALYATLHPCGDLENRIACLQTIKALGYETGGGFMIGLPGQTDAIIAQDLLLLRSLGCDMAGIGPFLPHPETPLRDCPHGSAEKTCRAVALARLLLPQSNLPATTALGVLDAGKKEHVFSRGANVVMRKITPEPYQRLYEIYPAELGRTDVPADRAQLEKQIRSLGRVPL